MIKEVAHSLDRILPMRTMSSPLKHISLPATLIMLNVFQASNISVAGRKTGAFVGTSCFQAQCFWTVACICLEVGKYFLNCSLESLKSLDC